MRRTIVALATPLLALGLLTGCGSTDTGNTDDGGTGVLNDADEAQDVVKVQRKDEKYLGTTVVVTVKNSSAKTSDYLIEVTAENASGSKQYDSTTVIIDNVKPDQTATGDGIFTKKIPDDAKIEVGSVDRSESL